MPYELSTDLIMFEVSKVLSPSVLLALCDKNPPITSQTAVNAGFDVLFYVNLKKLLNKPSSCR